GLEFAFAARVYNTKLHTENACGFLHFGRLVFGICIGVVDEHGNLGALWHDLPQQSQPLRLELAREKGDPRDVAAWPIEACNQAGFHRIAAETEHDWNGRGRGLCCERRRATGRDENGHLPTHEVGRERGQAVVLTARKTVFDEDIATFHIASLAQAAT